MDSNELGMVEIKKYILKKQIIGLIILKIIMFLFIIPLNAEAFTTNSNLDYDKSRITFTLNDRGNESDGNDGSNNNKGVLPQAGESRHLFLVGIGLIAILGFGWGFIKKKEESEGYEEN